ncbi:MAG: hypothetical protein QOF51_1205 [Chloroflexota bacterium]|jgi:hypothetical protein|nr:hypothetical protein [Chloroflexota bacterium]
MASRARAITLVAQSDYLAELGQPIVWLRIHAAVAPVEHGRHVAAPVWLEPVAHPLTPLVHRALSPASRTS